MLGLKKYLTVLGVLFLSFLFSSCGGNSRSSSSNNNTGGNPSANSGTTTTGGSNTGSSGGNGSGSSASSIASYAYVGNNNVITGTISGFAINADGTATAIPAVNGASGELATNNHFLLATDGTNIVSYSIGSGGALSQVATINGVAHNDTPSDSAVGVMSLDRSGASLYAGEINFQGTDNGAFAHFQIGSDGKIAWADNSSISSNFGSALTFSQDDKYAYGHGCYFLTFEVPAFSRGMNGTLAPVASNAQPPAVAESTDICPGPSSASPTGDVLVSAMFPEGQQGATDLLVSYQIHSDGSLGPPSAPAANPGFHAINDVKVDPSGSYVAVATDAGVQMYSLSSTGALSPIGTPVTSNVTFNNVQWDAAGHVFATSTTTNALYVFNNTNGALTQASGSPHAVTNAGTLAVASAK